MDTQKLSYNDMGLKNDCEGVSNGHVQWVCMESGNGVFDEDFNGSTCDDDSILSSSSSSDIEEDDGATSSTSSSLSSSNSGPLYELSQLMEHLPIKRGLSSFFQGKSQSFTSLASVRSLEDLAKKENPCRKTVKSCSNKYKPKAIIRKKSCARLSKASNFVSLFEKRGTCVSTNSCRPSISVVQKHF